MNPKYVPYRNKAILDLAKGQPCQHCGRNDGTTVSAHANGLFFGKGTGKKSDDCYVAYLCGKCHYAYDNKQTIPYYKNPKSGYIPQPFGEERIVSQDDFNGAMFKTWKIILQHFDLVKK